MPGFRQHFFRQNSLYQDSPKFNNAKVSGFTVYMHKIEGSTFITLFNATRTDVISLL